MKAWIWAPVRGSPPLSQGPQHALLDPDCLLEGNGGACTQSSYSE